MLNLCNNINVSLAMRCFPLLLAALAPASLWASAPVTNLRYAPDVTTVLSGTTVGPAQVAADDLAGSVSLISIGAIPAERTWTATR